jgi:proteasome lid subunit RPN8/RPN11
MDEIDWLEKKEYIPAKQSLDKVASAHHIYLNGSRNNSELVVLISFQAFEAMQEYLQHDVLREHGGVFIGEPFLDQESGRPVILIHAAIPAMESSGSGSHLEFTPEAWEYIAGILTDSFPDMVVVGWFHSHPGLGVFFSETDRSTQMAFFSNDWSVAAVLDPIQDRIAWFAGRYSILLPDCNILLSRSGNLERVTEPLL